MFCIACTYYTYCIKREEGGFVSVQTVLVVVSFELESTVPIKSGRAVKNNVFREMRCLFAKRRLSVAPKHFPRARHHVVARCAATQLAVAAALVQVCSNFGRVHRRVRTDTCGLRVRRSRLLARPSAACGTSVYDLTQLRHILWLIVHTKSSLRPRTFREISWAVGVGNVRVIRVSL